ncbi:MAG TPA: pyridine nucleotide-disulfide oxidoreductase [Firmicutes bacterium]|nr:pyridine nucleotide-disulfide oxidoreductase [Bacillota bacterium]
MKVIDLIVIGGGSAGLASAISAFDEGINNILLIERSNELGGILNQCIHNGFGLNYFKEELTGPEYANRFINEFKKRKINYLLNSLVTDISSDLKVTFINNDGIQTVKAKAIICALGCNERTYGQISIPGDRPNGVFTAGLAQKYLNIDGFLVGKNVYILGSGDIGLIMARRMTLEGAKVIGVSELMPYSNGLNRNIVQCLNDFNIPLRLSNTVTRIIGKHNLEAIEIADVDKNFNIIENTKKIIQCDALLLSVGLYPFINLLSNAGVKLYNETKGVYINQNYETSIKGIFVTGNSLHVHDLVDEVSKESIKVGKCASDYIKDINLKVNKIIFTHAKQNLLYLLPNEIEVTNSLKEVNFSFRVNKIINKGTIYIYNKNTIIKKIKKLYMTPSEMIFINLKDVDFNFIDEINIEVVED